MLYHEAIDSLVGRSLDHYSEFIIQDDGEGPYIKTWNAVETQPTEQEITTRMTKCKNDINITCTCESLVGCKYKIKKIEELGVACNAEILAGFYSSAFQNDSEEELAPGCNTGNQLYSFGYEDQLNMTGLTALIATGYTGDIMYKSAEMTVCCKWTVNEFANLGSDAKAHRETLMAKYFTKKLAVLACTSKAAVDAITWDSVE